MTNTTNGKNKIILRVRRRINKQVKGVDYWKYYVDLPAKVVNDLNLKINDVVIIKKSEPVFIWAEPNPHSVKRTRFTRRSQMQMRLTNS